MNKQLGNLGLCRKAGCLILGFDAVKKAAQQGEAKLLLCTADISEKTKKEVRFFSDRYQILMREIPFNMEQVQDVIGKRIGVLAVTSENFADLLSRVF